MDYDEREDVSRQMIDIMFTNSGIGLAAPQVGIDQRMFVMRDPDNPKDSEKALVFVDPVITQRSQGTYTDQEGCLSTPGVRTTIVRSKAIDVQFLEMPLCDNLITWHFEGINARCIQHEIDHLDGIMFFDHIKGNITRKLFLERYEKSKKKHDRIR